MGRRKLDLDKESLTKLWELYQTSTRIAKVVKCHPSTIKRKSREFDIQGLKTGPKKGASPMKSSFGLWLANYHDVLPRKTTEIAELSGCSFWAITSYMYRLRRLARELINSQLWRHNGPPVLWTDHTGVNIPDKAFDVVSTRISRFGSIEFRVRLKTGSYHIFRMTAEQYKKLYEA